MLWSLIYRKLKGNRGNTMITIYEAERLISLIRNINNNKELDHKNQSLTYDFNTCSIISTIEKFSYSGRTEPINILPRLIEKYNLWKAHEAHLQMYITQNIGLGTNHSLDSALGITGKKLSGLAMKFLVGLECNELMLCCRL